MKHIIETDPQDPLPESNWIYRRFTLIGSLVVLLVHRSWQVYWNHPLDRWTDFLILSILIAYTVAPSGEQIIKMVATVALLKPGVRAVPYPYPQYPDPRYSMPPPGFPGYGFPQIEPPYHRRWADQVSEGEHIAPPGSPKVEAPSRIG